MKKILYVFLIISPFNLYTENIPSIKWEKAIETSKFADFKTAYLHLRKWEGNYGWYKEDPGGETYAGIARRYNPLWRGWAIIDEYKTKNTIKHNEFIEGVEFNVTDYYLSIWMKEGFDKIKDQEMANYLFDYRNSGPIAYIHIRRVLLGMGYLVEPQGYMDERLIHVINIIDKDMFLKSLKHIRMTYYVKAVENHPEQLIFLRGWIARVYDI